MHVVSLSVTAHFRFLVLKNAGVCLPTQTLAIHHHIGARCVADTKLLSGVPFGCWCDIRGQMTRKACDPLGECSLLPPSVTEALFLRQDLRGCSGQMGCVQRRRVWTSTTTYLVYRQEEWVLDKLGDSFQLFVMFSEVSTLPAFLSHVMLALVCGQASFSRLLAILGG